MRRLAACQSVRDHPRSRGVYSSCGQPGRTPSGSSPLARGLPSEAGLALIRGGIIPARAGFTSSDGTPSDCDKDHPRSRGVYAGIDRCDATQYGSSPLARGLRRHDTAVRPHRGIIPARAGFTRRWWSRRTLMRDHPRSRGVYAWGDYADSVGTGSSPLARGLRPGR